MDYKEPEGKAKVAQMREFISRVFMDMEPDSRALERACRKLREN
jgi:hypothetical protein